MVKWKKFSEERPKEGLKILLKLNKDQKTGIACCIHPFKMDKKFNPDYFEWSFILDDSKFGRQNIATEDNDIWLDFSEIDGFKPD